MSFLDVKQLETIRAIEYGRVTLNVDFCFEFIDNDNEYYNTVLIPDEFEKTSRDKIGIDYTPAVIEYGAKGKITFMGFIDESDICTFEEFYNRKEDEERP